jgi:hypothetical protein
MPKGIYKRPGYNGTPEERFLKYVDKSGDCWIWTGTKVGNGYGHFRGRNGLILSHRFSYEQYIGPIPEGMNVLHSCDNPVCVNPQHLFLGTHTENMRDMWGKGRKSHRGEKNSRAILTLKNVAEIRSMEGEFSRKELSERYGVSRSTIGSIITNKSWILTS